jgi:DNA repair exonuclease SbcCD ATPase subunit
MVSLEQVKLLETKVAKAIDFVKSLSEENAALRGKLDGYRRRIDELEVLVKAFREDQGRIEAGIMSALERLNQFEDAVERGFSDDQGKPVAEEAPAEVVAESIEAEPKSEGLQADSDEAILAELEAEEAAARAAANRVADVTAVSPEPPAPPVDEQRNDQGGELDIF